MQPPSQFTEMRSLVPLVIGSDGVARSPRHGGALHRILKELFGMAAEQLRAQAHCLHFYFLAPPARFERRRPD